MNQLPTNFEVVEGDLLDQDVDVNRQRLESATSFPGGCFCPKAFPVQSSGEAAPVRSRSPQATVQSRSAALS